MQIGKGAAGSFDHCPPGNYIVAMPQGLLGAGRTGCCGFRGKPAGVGPCCPCSHLAAGCCAQSCL